MGFLFPDAIGFHETGIQKQKSNTSRDDYSFITGVCFPAVIFL